MPELPQKLEGTSLVPVLKRQSRDVNDAVFHVYPRSRQGEGAILGRAVRTDRYRLVEWKKPNSPESKPEFELYDYKKDPFETKNLAAAEPRLVKKLQAHLAALGEAKPQINSSGQTRPPIDRAELFKRRDSNGDGTLTREEFLKDQPDPAAAPRRFVRFDTNKDGILSREEFIQAGNPVQR